MAVAIVGGSPDRFGYEWNTYSEIAPEHEQQFRRWLPFYAPAEWSGKCFVDVGCGMGRNSYWPMRDGAAKCLAVDVDDRSLAAARRNLAGFAGVEVRKCSAYDLPWHDAADIVFSIGVIHHLEFPERAMGAMVQAAKPGAEVAIWVYGRENNSWLLWALDPARKLLFSRLPVAWVHALSLPLAAIVWLLLRTGLNQIEYFRQARRFSFTNLRSIVFDQMLPRIAHYWSRSEVIRLMQNAGLEAIELSWVNQMSWAARGKKPL